MATTTITQDAKTAADVSEIPSNCGLRFLSRIDGNNKLLNRWSRSCVYVIVSICCCAIYYGWQQFQKVLFTGGVYAWLCEDEIPGWNYAEHGACDAQNGRVQTLYTVASAMEYVVGVFAGVLVDHWGPRTCGMIGMAALGFSVLLLLLCGQGFQLYIVAMALMGGAVNMVGFPILMAADFFPGHETGVITFFITCQIGASLMGVIFFALVRRGFTMNQVFSGYLLFIWLPLLFIFGLTLPCTRKRQIVPKPQQQPQQPVNVEVSASSHSDMMQNSITAIKRREASTTLSSGLPADDANKMAEIKGNWKDFGKQLMTPEVELFACYYVLQLLQFVYYPTTTLQMYGDWISDFAGYIMPSQALFGLIFGYLVERVTTLPLCWLLNTLNLATFALMLTRSEKLQYLTVVLNCISQSFIYTSKFTYIAEIYAPNNFGKLSGYIGFLGGIFTFVNIPIAASTNYTFWAIFFMVVSGCLYFLLAFLTFRYQKGIRYVKTDIDSDRIDTEEINKAA